MRLSDVLCCKKRCKNRVRKMTNALDFRRDAQLLKAAPGMYRHNGDAFPGLYLNVGKRRSTWYLKARVNGKTKSVKLGAFPTMTAAQALKQASKETAHHGNETTAAIRRVRDAWREYVADALANERASEKHLTDMERKLERYASDILGKSPTQVSLLDVRRCLNAIPSVSTRHHVKAGINNAYSMLDIPTPIQRGKIKLKQVGSRDTYWKVLCDADETIDRRDWSPMWEAVMDIANPLRRIAWVVMLFTGIRADDVRSLRWDQVDLQRKTIRLPKLKNGEDRTLPICDTVVRALTSIRAGGFDQVFPASSKTGYIDHLDILRHPTVTRDSGRKDKMGEPIMEGVPVLRQHDARHHFTSACGPARIPSYAVAFLRGDITSKDSDDDMAMHYQEDLAIEDLVADIEKVILQRIKVTPSFDLE